MISMKARFNYFLYLVLLITLLLPSCKKNSNSTETETFTLQTTVSPSEAGSVSPQGGSYDDGSQVELSASANEGWVFSEWNGDLSGNSNPAAVTINKNMSINALFEQLTYPLTVDVEGQGDVSEQIVNAKTDYENGTIVELTGNPAEHWEFIEWQGDLSGSENPATITMDGAKTVTAVFEEKEYPLTITIEGEGDVSEEIVNGKTDYTHGTMVELMGNPASEWQFIEWTGDLETEDNPATITMDGPKNINAIFEFGFNEDFEDGVADNWIFTDDRFSVQDGKLRFSTGNDGNWGGGVYDQIFTDYKVEVKVTRTRSDETEDYTLAIFIRVQGNVEEALLQNGYMIAITQSGWGAVFKYENGIETEFSPWVRIPQINDELGEYNVVAVNAVGSTFEIFINGEYIITLTDDTFSDGYVGIGTYASEDGNNRVFWDYIKVTQADALQNEKIKSHKMIERSTNPGVESKGHF